LKGQVLGLSTNTSEAAAGASGKPRSQRLRICCQFAGRSSGANGGISDTFSARAVMADCCFIVIIQHCGIGLYQKLVCRGRYFI
jgi:hypothetical protein